MKNFVSQGNTLTFLAAAALTSGQGVLNGSLFGVVAEDAALGEQAVANLTGVYDLPKAASQAWTVGALIYWDDAADVCTTVATANTLIGAAVLAVGSGATETTGRVRLNGTVG